MSRAHCRLGSIGLAFAALIGATAARAQGGLASCDGQLGPDDTGVVIEEIFLGRGILCAAADVNADRRVSAADLIALAAGPRITFLGLASADGRPAPSLGTLPDGTVVFARSSGFGFSLVVEAAPGGNGATIGTTVFDSAPGNPTRRPDIQVQVDRPLGAGSAEVCDEFGVPDLAPDDFSLTQPVSNALNDLGCRMRVATTRNSTCTQDAFGQASFVVARSRAQFCLPVDRLLAFRDGDTRITAQVRDVAGKLGPAKRLIVRVASGPFPPTFTPVPPTETPTPTDTPTPRPTVTPTRTVTLTRTVTATRTASATITRTATRTPTPIPTDTATRTRTATPLATPTPTRTSTGAPSGTPTRSPTGAPGTATRTSTRTLTGAPGTATRTVTGALATATRTPTRTPTRTASAAAGTATRTGTRTPTRTVTRTPTPARTPTRTASATPTRTPTRLASATRTITPTPLANLGPVIGFFGVTRPDDLLIQPDGTQDGIPVYQRPFGFGFSLVVEAAAGASRSAPGRSTFDEGGRPDLQIEVSRSIGNGSATVCDNEQPNLGGVPAINPPDFSDNPTIDNRLNDLGCRFEDGEGRPQGRSCAEENACVRFDDGHFGCVAEGTRQQYCAPISRPLEFPTGDTLVTVRVRDGVGNLGAPAQLIIRVVPP